MTRCGGEGGLIEWRWVDREAGLSMGEEAHCIMYGLASWQDPSLQTGKEPPPSSHTQYSIPEMFVLGEEALPSRHTSQGPITHIRS